MDAQLPSFPDGHRDSLATLAALMYQLYLLEELSNRLFARFQQTGNQRDLDWAIALHRLVINSWPHHFPGLWAWLADLADLRSLRYQRWKRYADLERAIVLHRDALVLCPRDHEQYCNLLAGEAKSLHSRFELKGKVEDLDEAIELQRSVVASISEGHPDHPTSLGQLGAFLITRFQYVGSPEDLTESILFLRATVSFLPEGHPYRPLSLNNLANSLKTRFEQSGRVDDLNEAVELHRESLSLRPHGHPHRPSSLNNLAASLMTRFEQSGRVDDLNEAVEMNRDALSLRPHGHPDRPSSLGNLASSLMTRFGQSGNADDLNEGVEMHRDALSLLPHGHPDRPSSLSNLAMSLMTRFRQSGNADDLNEAVEMHRESLSLRPHGNPDRSSSLNNLASSLQTRFEQTGRVDDLNEAVSLHRESLSLRPHGHPDRPSSLNNLASSLMTRFEQSGRVDDLNEAVALHRESLSLRPHGNPDRSSSLNNLASSLKARFEQSGRVDDLNEAVSLHREAVSLRPHGRPDRPSSLNNLANILHTRFEQSGRVDDLNEAVALHREALSLRPHGNLDRPSSLGNLANSLMTRFKQGGRVDDLNEAVMLYQDTLALCPHGYPDLSGIMSNMAKSLHTRSQMLDQAQDFEECIQLLAKAANHPFSSALVRLDAAFQWALFARSRNHNTTLAAYRTSIALLQRALTIRPNLAARHDLLTDKAKYQMLGVDAASYAIEIGDLAAAVELLEQGRALLWSQMRGLRTPLDRLADANGPFAERFRHISSQLEALVTSSERRSAGSGLEGDPNGLYDRRRDDERMKRMRQLSEEQEELIGKIRNVSGFEDFLQAPPFQKLQRAASEGPVVMINHSDFRSDVLIVLARQDVPCICVPLDKDWRLDATYLHRELVEGRNTRRVTSASFDEALRRVMKALWDRVVSKVVAKLRELGVCSGSRIWWCPTSILSMLPFHAAGPYQSENGGVRYLLDDYISSYTPTLTSLIVARANVRVGTQKLLFVGDRELPSTTKEYFNICKNLKVWKQLVDDEASRDAVLEALKKARWVHFSCHGSLDSEKPFESSFVLPGGKLTLLDLSRARLRNAEFAFLSACHSAEQPYSSAVDEALHLAAAIQFCGFRSVAGTMWQLLDRDGPVLADVVYFHLMNDVEGMKFKGAAAAVRRAALHLRSQKEWGDGGAEIDIMTERWVNLVHIGA